MKKPNLQGFLFLVFIVFVLIGTGCGGGTNQGKDAPNIGGSVSGYGIDGIIINGDVTIYSYNGSRGDLLAQSKTDAKGQFSATIGNYSGPILIDVRNGYYVEEASGYRVDLNVGDYLSAVTFYSAGGSLSNVMVTPMTTLAASLAGYYQGAGDNVSNAINKANTAMSSLILLDILNTYPADLTDEKNKPGSLTNSARYGVVLAALSQMSADISAQNGTQPHRVYNSMALTKALANDISDGKLNGKKVADDVYLGITKLDSYTMRRTLGVAAINFMNSTYNKSGLGRGDVENYLSQIAINSGSLFPSENPPLPIDDVAPTITFTEPTANVYVAGALRVRVVATDFSDIKALTVTSPSFPNRIFFDYDSSASIYLLEVDTTTIADGNLTINVSATDVADNTSTASITVVVDNTRPQINITSPVNNSFTNLAVVTVTGTITDAGSGVSSINFVRGSQSTAATITGNAFTANLATGADAQYDYTVNITDLVGNQSSSIYTLKKDTVAPGIGSLYATTYYDEMQISATVDSNTRIVSYNKVEGDQTENLQDVNMTINKYITRLSSGNSFKENVLSWDSSNGGGTYDYNIPYYKFTVSDPGFVGSSSVNLVVTYSFSQQINNSWVLKRDWAAVPYDTNNTGGFYVIPISTEYLGPDLTTVDNTVNNRVTVRIVDEAGNIGYKDFYFKLNLLGPPIITIYDPTLSASPYFTRTDSLYLYNFDARQVAYGRNLRALAVLISNPNPVTVYVDPRTISYSVVVNKRVIGIRGADSSAAASTYGAEYASKVSSYTLPTTNLSGGFRDVLTQLMLSMENGYYVLLPGQTAVAYSNFDNYGYGVYNSGLRWNWEYGYIYNSCAPPPTPSGSWTYWNAAVGIACDDPPTRYEWTAVYTTVPQYVIVDDYFLQFNLGWSSQFFTGPHISGVNTQNFNWRSDGNINSGLATWVYSQSSTCNKQNGNPSSIEAHSCVSDAVNNVNASDRVRQALP